MDLRGEAGQFADELSGLLNLTVCDGIRLTPVVADPYRARVGYSITKDVYEPRGIPLTLGNKAATAYLGISFRLGPDKEDEHLMVTSSFMSVALDADLNDQLLHYDYERDKGDGYPEAHLQVSAAATVWDSLCERTQQAGQPLAKLHLPVGGRRYRPTLEDFVDFLITEGIAEGRPGWSARVEQGRKSAGEKQLRAAVRRNPAAALDQLREMRLLD